MPASPARIPLMTSDGIVLSRVDLAVRAAHPNAADASGSDREFFFDNEADQAALLDEYFNWRKQPGRIHEAVEVEATFGLGISIALTPAIPQVNALDDGRGLNVFAKIRAYAADYTTERFSLELLG